MNDSFGGGIRQQMKNVLCVTTTTTIPIGPLDQQSQEGEGMITPPDSLLPPSEPPHINNWFSTYENESLVLETNPHFGFGFGFSDQPSTSTDTNNDNITSTIFKPQFQDSASPDSPLLTPDLHVESEPPAIQNWFSSYAYESPGPTDDDDDDDDDDDMDKFILSPDYKHIMLVANGKQPWKEVEKAENLSQVPSDDMTCHHQILKACDTDNTDNTSTQCSKDSTESPNEDANVNSPKHVNTNQMLPEAISLDANGHGDDDGFVSIKSKSKRENYKSMYGGDQKRASSYVSKMKKGNQSAARKILGDVTNIDEHSGKWKCPQKRKPEIGPPLKQLRLGQWFRYS